MKQTRKIYSAITLVLFVFLAFASAKKEDSKSSSEASGKSDSKTEEKKEETKKENWSFSDEVDKMTNKKMFFAECRSTNRVEFKFPYNESGGSSFSIIVRNLQDGAGNEVLVKATKGHFMTSLMGNETVKVKFDEEQAYDVVYMSAKDIKGNLIFLQGSDAFIAKLKAGKKLMLEAEFVNHGKEILYFDIEGLKWDK